MAEFLHYQKVKPHPESSKIGSKREAILRRAASLLIGVLVIILISELIFYFLVVPQIVLRSVQLETDTDITTEQVIQLGNIPVGELFHRINEEEIHNNLITLPNIKMAEVRRIFPNTLSVTLIGRKPLGILMVDYDGVRLPALIDEDGVVYRIGYGIRTWDLPVIQGIAFDKFELGARVHESYLMMLKDIHHLLDADSQLLRAFSEFYVDEVYKGVYEWILMPVHIPVQVRASPGLNKEKGLYILKILDVLKQRGIDGITEIDFRAGDVVYNRGGGNDGL